MIRTTGVDHVVLHVSDVERSKAFYTEILGMTVISGGGRAGLYACRPPGRRTVQKAGRCAVDGRQ